MRINDVGCSSVTRSCIQNYRFGHRRLPLIWVNISDCFSRRTCHECRSTHSCQVPRCEPCLGGARHVRAPVSQGDRTRQMGSGCVLTLLLIGLIVRKRRGVLSDLFIDRLIVVPPACSGRLHLHPEPVKRHCCRYRRGPRLFEECPPADCRVPECGFL